MHDRPAWAARDRRSADRMGAVLLLSGAILLLLGVAVIGWFPGWGGVGQVVTLVLCVVLAGVVARCAGRLPWWSYPAICGGAIVSVAGLVPSDDTLQLVALPLFLLVVVYVSHWFGTALARLVTGMAVLGELWVYARTGGWAVTLLSMGYVVGVTVLVHVLLSRSADRQRDLVDELTHDARHDGLTGCLNRRAFDTELLHRAVREQTALLLVDIDGLKEINDRYGHQTGDAAIRQVAVTVTSGVRRDDAVVGRLGGDELAVLLRGCDADAAARRARDLVAAVAGTPLRLPDGGRLPLGVSVGVAVSAPGRDLYASADEALYTAKSGGRGRAAGAD